MPVYVSGGKNIYGSQSQLEPADTDFIFPESIPFSGQLRYLKPSCKSCYFPVLVEVLRRLWIDSLTFESPDQPIPVRR